MVDKNLYVGCTKDLKKRIKLHNASKVYSTNKRKPMRIIYYEAFLSQEDAFKRERWLKTGWGRNQLRKILQNSLKI